MPGYEFREDAKTFEVEFYYINFIDSNGSFQSEYFEKIDIKNHALNRAKYTSKNACGYSVIPYNV